ncbi:hypothetical protein [Actinoallomurus acaciae]|uniref:Uncharacterized protein n=1 Tax=Actinoallomurus acaciae TaxID=502577 RepID=A0ABV5YR47_9ACTN
MSVRVPIALGWNTAFEEARERMEETAASRYMLPWTLETHVV